MQCTPLKLLTEENPQEHEASFELVGLTSAFNDLILWWRTLQLLEALPVIDDTHFYIDLFIAAGRADADDDYEQQIIQEIRSLLGDACYEEILCRPVPLEIIRLLITLVDEGHDMHGAFFTITEEIDAGTIRWSQDLKRIGVQHPDHVRAVKAAKEQLIDRYQVYLCSYATFRNCSYELGNRKRKAMIMLVIEWCLYHAVERGVEMEYGEEMAALLSIMLALIECDNAHERLGRTHPIDRKGHTPFIRPPVEEHAETIVDWFLQSFSQEPTDEQRGALLETLHTLSQRWRHLPVVNPLVS